MIVEEHYLRLLMGRYYIRLNCAFRFGCFAIFERSVTLFSEISKTSIDSDAKTDPEKSSKAMSIGIV